MMNRDPLQRYFDAANSATNISNVSLDERFPHSAAPRSGRHSCSEAPFPVLAPDHGCLNRGGPCDCRYCRRDNALALAGR